MIAHYIRAINRRFPKLVVRTADLNEEGQFNDVLIVNDTLVFRFARVFDAMEGLEFEAELLHNLQGRLPLPVPNPIYTHFDDEMAFMGYRMIPGEPLRRHVLSGSSQSQRALLARQLAAFLVALHRVDPADALLSPYENDDDNEAWAELYVRVRKLLFPLMRSDARNEVSAHFDGYFNDPDLSNFTPRVRHGDFGPGNLLYDPEEGALTGIIDFGSAGLGDPAADFAGLLSSYGEDFYRRCAETYPDMLAALPRARFYIGTFALQEALFGAENDDAEAFEDGMAPYR
jgi:aminoglycoside 2''-phosphotransferase